MNGSELWLMNWNIVKFCSLNTLNNWILMPQQHMQ